MKTAVVLFNLGGPDSLESVRPFLFNLFNDKAIIGAPKPIRYLLAKFISGKREKKAQGIYAQIGGKSPIVELTDAQAKSLEAQLGTGYKVFTCMRYWHPMAPEVAKQVSEYKPDKIILLPLYPQFSTTTSQSSIDDFKKHYGDANYQTICCYPLEENFINSHAEMIRAQYEKFPNARVLFSAHGLPKKVIEDGDSYQWQVEQTSKAVADKLGIKDWVVCYQSKVGPLEWIGPSTESEIERAAHDGKDIILTPIAFVSEHSETLVELDIQFKEFADEKGIKNYIRIPALGTQPDFIKSLALLCQPEYKCAKICPKEFGKCPNN
jgi:ferrochelatase